MRARELELGFEERVGALCGGPILTTSGNIADGAQPHEGRRRADAAIGAYGALIKKTVELATW